MMDQVRGPFRFSSIMLLGGMLLLSPHLLFASPNGIQQERLDLPTTGYRLHAFDESQILPKDFNRYTEYHSIRQEQKEMIFNLPAGTQNTYDNFGIRIEAHRAMTWDISSPYDWELWEGTFRLDRLGVETRGYSILQLRSYDTQVQWEFSINVNTQKQLILNHRRLRDEVLQENLVNGHTFHIKAASNGRKYKVWLNGSLVSEKEHQMDPTGSSTYDWRFGIAKVGSSPTNEDTTRLAIYNLQYGLSDSLGDLVRDRVQLPTSYRLHAFDNSQIESRDFDRYTDYFRIRRDAKEMVFDLPEGTVNTYDNAGVRVEAHAMKDWTTTPENDGDWEMWEGTYRIEQLGADRGYAILQMKSGDRDVQWEFSITVNPENQLILDHRRLPNEVLLDGVEGETFHIKAVSNGRRYKVWYNYELVSDVEHQMDPTGASKYDWRFGIYKGGFDRMLNGATSQLAVYNIQHGLSDSNGILLSDIFENDLEGSKEVAKLMISCDNWFRLVINERQFGFYNRWKTAPPIYTYLWDTNVITVDARDFGGIAGFIMEIQYNSQRIGTDGLWEVSLDRQNWLPASDYSPYGAAPWFNDVENMPADTAARWIWSNDRYNHNQVYFRYTFNVKKQIVPLMLG